MNFFATPTRRKLLFACLYLSEGAPIGFIWLALPTRLRTRGVAVEDITWLAAVLVLPWTFKFVWAPLVDLLRGRRWTLRHWIVAAQSVMGLTLVPLAWMDVREQFALLAALLSVHALAAATQDVAIDALCISTTDPGERGQYNGWMQAGMLLGRATMGGGALVMARHVGDAAVVGLLVLLTTSSLVLLLMSPPPKSAESEAGGRPRVRRLVAAARSALADFRTWLGILLALVGGAAFKLLEVIYGPFLVDRGFDEATIGWFSLGPMIGAMIAGSVAGGWITDRIGPRRCSAAALVAMALTITALAHADQLPEGLRKQHLLTMLAATAFGIGLFTASSYALYMDLTRPAIAATQFSAFMGATNGCESWSSFVGGRIIAGTGYPSALLTMCLVSLFALPLIAAMRRPSDRSGAQ